MSLRHLSALLFGCIVCCVSISCSKRPAERDSGDGSAGEELRSEGGSQPGPPGGAIASESPLVKAARQLGQGQPMEAEKTLQSLLIVQPKNFEARVLLVETYLRQMDFDSALADLTDLVQEYPSKPLIRRQLASVLNERGFRFEANEHLRGLASEISLSVRELTALINPMLTWGSFREKPRVDDLQLIKQQGLLNTVAALRANGDVRDGLKVLAKSKLIQANHPAAVAQEGWLLSLNQDFDELELWARRAGAESRAYPAYWLALGELVSQTDRDQAIHCYLAACMLEPGCEPAFAGMVRCKSGNDSEGARLLSEHQKRIAESKAIARELSTRRRGDVGLAAEMGRVLNELGRPMESLAWQQAVITAVSPSAPQLRVLESHKAKVLERFPTGVNQRLSICGYEAPSEGKLNQLVAQYALRSSGAPKVKSTVLQGDSNEDRKSASAVGSMRAGQRVTPSVPRFQDRSKSLGIQFRYINSDKPVEQGFRLFESLGGGVACIDFDLDSHVDLYLGQANCHAPDGLAQSSNQLFRNLTEEFTDATDGSQATDFGYTHGVAAGDLNQDGFPDLVIANIGVNRVLMNQGDGTFRESDLSYSASWQQGKLSLSIAIADVNGDALPDIFEAVYVDDPRVFEPIKYNAANEPLVLPGPRQFRPGESQLYICSSDQTYQHQALGERGSAASTSMGVIVSDVDNDLLNEIFVANDQNANHLWGMKDAGPGEPMIMVDTALTQGCALGAGGKPFACMGIAISDFDFDGRQDFHVTNFLGECSNLYLQRSPGNFLDQAIRYQLDIPTNPMVAFGTQVIDYDNNATADLMIANGHIEDLSSDGKPFRMPTQVLSFDGTAFRNQPVAGDASYWSSSHLGRAVARLDWNRDGRVDAAVTHLQAPFSLLENQTDSKGQFLQVQLVGVISERDAIGATVVVEADGLRFRQVVQAGDGYLCKNEPVLFYGLGEIAEIDALTVQWPSGLKQTFRQVRPGARYTLIEGDAEPWVQ